MLQCYGQFYNIYGANCINLLLAINHATLKHGEDVHAAFLLLAFLCVTVSKTQRRDNDKRENGK